MQISAFKSLSIASRLIIGFLTLLGFLIALAISQSVTLRIVSGQLKQVVLVNNGKVELAHTLLDSINELAIRARAVILTADLAQLDAEIKRMNDAEKNSVQAQTALKAALDPITEEERRLIDAISGAQERAMPFFTKAAKQAQEGNNFAAVKTLTEKAAPDEEGWRKNVAEFIALQQQASARSAMAAEAAQTRIAMISTAMAVAAVLIGAVIAYRIIRSITGPIARAVSVSERIAQGDLTAKIEATTHDETGRLLHAIGAMQANLRTLVTDIQTTAASIHHASSEVAAGNHDLSTRTEQAASSLQQTAASMDQLTDTVRRSADSAMQANELASSAAEVAARGGSVVSQVVATMNEINTSSKRISDIIAVIDGIAFQTNILALNAAVEAARAGEQGRGFAVVANEVRSLAGRSAEAAKEIKSLIGASVDKVEAGSRLVADAGSTMSEIVGSVQRVTTVMGEITASSTEQRDGITQVNHAVTQLDEATQQNAALVEQGAAAAEMLKEQAARLTAMVSGFRVTA